MFENDDPAQRKNLITALTEKGLDALELNSGGGTMHVIIQLFDYWVDPPVNAAEDLALRLDLKNAAKNWPYAGYLYIATNNDQTDCEVGLMGVDGKTDAQVSMEEWAPVGSLEEAVETIQRYWSERDKWIRAFLVGELVTW